VVNYAYSGKTGAMVSRFLAKKLMISENSRVVFAYIYCLIKGSSAKRLELLNWRSCTSAWQKFFLRRVLFPPLFCSL